MRVKGEECLRPDRCVIVRNDYSVSETPGVNAGKASSCFCLDLAHLFLRLRGTELKKADLELPKSDSFESTFFAEADLKREGDTNGVRRSAIVTSGAIRGALREGLWTRNPNREMPLEGSTPPENANAPERKVHSCRVLSFRPRKMGVNEAGTTTTGGMSSEPFS